MSPYRSRLSRVEERKNIRKALFYVFLAAAGLILIITLGLPALAKLAAFLSDLKGSSLPIDKEDNTPPAPPRFEVPAEHTNRQVVEIKGFGEPGATVKLFANTLTKEVVINNEGYFLYDFSLQKGENHISAYAIDEAGNQSQNSGEFIITYDDEAPVVTVTTPSDGENFYGSKQRQITVEGTTEDTDNLTINGRVIALETDGTFTYSVTLQEGENSFEIVAKDKAGNEDVVRLSVIYWR